MDVIWLRPSCPFLPGDARELNVPRGNNSKSNVTQHELNKLESHWYWLYTVSTVIGIGCTQ